MKRFNRGDLVRIIGSNIFGVVTEVMIVDDKIKYLVLNIEGNMEKLLGDGIKEITRVRPLNTCHG